MEIKNLTVSQGTKISESILFLNQWTWYFSTQYSLQAFPLLKLLILFLPNEGNIKIWTERNWMQGPTHYTLVESLEDPDLRWDCRSLQCSCSSSMAECLHAEACCSGSGRAGPGVTSPGTVLLNHPWLHIFLDTQWLPGQGTVRRSAPSSLLLCLRLWLYNVVVFGEIYQKLPSAAACDCA